MSLTDFGWLFEETTLSLSPNTVPRGVDLVPEVILHPIKCKGDTEGPHGPTSCGSIKAQLGCTVLCVCQGGIVLQRPYICKKILKSTIQAGNI